MIAFDTPLKTNDQSIDRVLQAGLPALFVFVDSQLPTSLSEAMDSLARLHAGKLLVVQVAARENPASVRRFGFNRFPAVASVKDGKTLSQAEGVTSADLSSQAAYLLGTGPKPASAPASQPEAASRPSQPSGAASGHPVPVTDANFQREVLQSPIPVLVDFWAVWCGPCRMVEPTLEKMAREQGGRLKIAKVNVDENPYLSGQYKVQSIPTMLVVRNGQVIDRWMGALPEPALRSRVQAALNK